MKLLHYASSNQDEDIVAILLMHQASVDIADKKGHRARWYAQKERNAKIVSMLKNPDPTFVAAFVPDAVPTSDAVDDGRMDDASIESVRSAKPLETSYSSIVFHRFDIPEQLKKDYLEAAFRCEQSAIEYLKKKNVYKIVAEKAVPPYGNNTVLVDEFVEDIYYAGTGRRIMFGSLAGMPFMEVRVKLMDAESKTVICEKIISTNTNAWFAGVTGGTSDRYLPDRMGEIIGEYLYTIIPAGSSSN